MAEECSGNSVFLELKLEIYIYIYAHKSNSVFQKLYDLISIRILHSVIEKLCCESMPLVSYMLYTDICSMCTIWGRDT